MVWKKVSVKYGLQKIRCQTWSGPTEQPISYRPVQCHPGCPPDPTLARCHIGLHLLYGGEGLSLTPKDRLKSEKCEMFDCWCRYIYSLEKETHLIKPGSSEIKEKILSMLNLVTHLLPPAPWFIKELQCWWRWRGLHDGKSRPDHTNHHQFEQIYF